MALHPDAAARTWLADFQQRVRKRLARFDRELRWVDPEAIHLTLVFLGELPDPVPIANALEACRCVPMDLTVSGLGVFPNRRRPAVLWAGLAEPTGSLLKLQAEIAKALTPFVEPERRAFKAHLTLARIKGGGSWLGVVTSMLADGWNDAPGQWHVEHFSLMRSEQGSAGARHFVVREFGGDPAGGAFSIS